MGWTPLDESIQVSQAGHITDHQQSHTWANAFHAITVGADTTLSDQYGIVVVNTAGGTKTITLPSAATAGEGGFVIVRAGGSNVTVNRAGSDLFNDDDTSKVLASDGAAIGLVAVAGGTKWYITGERGAVT